MYYHFAFVAISVTMFGMAVGALIVYGRPHVFTAARVHAASGARGARFRADDRRQLPGAHLAARSVRSCRSYGVASVVLTYAVLSVPFTFSGIVVALALTRFPRQVSALYGADLAGAALGCVLLGPLLRVTDAPDGDPRDGGDCRVRGGAVFAGRRQPAKPEPESDVASGFSRKRLRLQRVTVLLVLAAIGNTVAARHDHAVAAARVGQGAIRGAADRRALEPLLADSRDRRSGEDDAGRRDGDSARRCRRSSTARELHLDIDSYAGTELTAFNGDPADVQHLKYDVTNVAHYLRPSSSVVVVGTGGGRDILSALVFGQRAVTGVEINPSILELVNGRFGDFTGHLDRDPRVRFVNDEARSYLARMRDPVDIIQISLIDTWAATASGAFVLTENSLYTLEAWTNFLEPADAARRAVGLAVVLRGPPGRGLSKCRAGGDDAAEEGREAPGRSLRHRAGPADADQGRARRHRHDPGVARSVLRRRPRHARRGRRAAAVRGGAEPAHLARRDVRRHRRRRAADGAARSVPAGHQRTRPTTARSSSTCCASATSSTCSAGAIRASSRST